MRVFEQTDLSTRRALIGATPGRAVHSRTPELKQTIEQLSSLLSRHYSSTFASDDLRRLRSLLEFPAPDFLHALGRAEDENSHSDVLAYLLDPRSAPGTAPAALARLAELLPSPEQWSACFSQAVDRDELSVRREVQIGRFWTEDPKALDRVDIVISGRTFVVAIENKVRAREHNRQTDTCRRRRTTSRRRETSSRTRSASSSTGSSARSAGPGVTRGPARESASKCRVR